MNSYADTFKVISDENRLKILEILSGGRQCACEILGSLPVTQPTLSHHLKVLCESGLIEAEKQGKNTYYSLNGESLNALSGYLDTLSEKTEEKSQKENDGWEKLVTFID
jgi:ArsR family transcriptional regulator